MRPRKTDRHLPSCVYEKNGAFYYVKKGKWTRLGGDLHAALVEYARIVALPENGLGALIDKALPSITAKVSESTRKQYLFSARRLQGIFAEFRADQVKHGDIVRMLDAFAHQPAVGNRLLTVLRLTFQWAMDRELVDQNPCLSVKRLAQGKRDRLISANEYAAIYKQCAPWLQCVIDLCYLTGQRIGDVLTIERADLREDGIYFQQQKTGKQLIVGWTPELKDAVERAKLTTGIVKAMTYLIAGRGGKLRAHSNVWRSFKVAAQKAGVENVTLHDLRAMAGTEADRQGMDPTALLGHTDRRTTAIYLRDKTAKVVSGPSKATQKKAG
ncbi:MAG: tyrosine-type recombinase/integrase [Pusillimonas sp.]